MGGVMCWVLPSNYFLTFLGVDTFEAPFLLSVQMDHSMYVVQEPPFTLGFSSFCRCLCGRYGLLFLNRTTGPQTNIGVPQRLFLSTYTIETNRNM